MTLEQVKIQVEKVTFLFRKHTIGIKEKHEVMKCPRNSQDHCEHSSGTVIWQNSQHKPFQIIQKITGEIQEGDIFISHYNKVRLVLKRQQEYSGVVLKRTNYKDILITVDNVDELELEEIKGSRVKIHSWVEEKL